MFINVILPLIVVLIIVSYMASSSIVGDSIDTKILYSKIPFTYNIEEVLHKGLENKCQSDPTSCSSVYNTTSQTMTFSFSDLSGYIPTNLKNDNLNGGTFTSLEIRDNNTTIRIFTDVPGDKARFIYLHHYAAKSYGIPPKCVQGFETSKPPCTTSSVYHDYPVSEATRLAL